MYRLAILNSHPIQYFAPLYRRLAQEPDIDLTVLYCSRQGVDPYVDSGFDTIVEWDTPLLEGYTFKFLNNIWKSQNVQGFFSLINPSIITELYHNRYDAVWIHGHNYATHLVAMCVANLCKTPVLMRGETHLTLKRSNFKRLLRTPTMHFFYKLCTCCLPIGTRNAQFYRVHGVPDNKMFTVPYTVDNDFFIQTIEHYRNSTITIRQELGIPDNKKIVLFASKLIARKRPLDVLQAFHQLVKENIPTALVFVGSGPDEKILSEYVRRHDLPDVYFMGFRNQSELPKFYAIADVFILPSENEPWGLVINEVMCGGIPVITTNEVGAADDLIRHGENGFLYPVGDIQSLVKYISLLCTDEQLRSNMGYHSRQIIREWSFDKCIVGIRRALEYADALSN